MTDQITELAAIRASLERIERAHTRGTGLVTFLAATGCAVILAAVLLFGAFLQHEFQIFHQRAATPVATFLPVPSEPVGPAYAFPEDLTPPPESALPRHGVPDEPADLPPILLDPGG